MLGKGSVVAMVSSVLRAAGYKVGTYTSPHLHHLGERISTDAASGGLSPQRLTQLVQQHRSALERCKEAEGGALSHFEVRRRRAGRGGVWVRWWARRGGGLGAAASWARELG